MKNTFITLSFLILSFCSYSQDDTLADQKFNWAIRIMDRWLVDHQPVCDICITTEKLVEMNIELDSAGKAYVESDNFVSMSDIFDALHILETLTEIKSTISLNLGTLGIICNDCSTYPSDRKNWICWYAENSSEIDPLKLEALKDVPRKR